MIIKSIAKHGGPVTNLIRYIFKERAVHPIFKPEEPKPVFVQGLKLTAADIRHLLQEKEDVQLLRQFYEQSPSRNIPEFVKTHLLEQLPSWAITHNLRRTSIAGIAQQYRDVEEGRIRKSSNATSLHHDIISFAPCDAQKLTRPILEVFIQQYIALRGSNALVLSGVHAEREHLHVHFLISGSSLNGKANRVSKEEFARIKDQMQELQKTRFPELSSLPRHGRSREEKVQGSEVQKNIKNAERASGKAALLAVLERSLQQARSSEQFYALIREAGHEPYFRNDRAQGVKLFGEQKFRYTNLGFPVESIYQLDVLRDKQEKELKALQSLRQYSIERDKGESRLSEFERTYEATAEPAEDSEEESSDDLPTESIEEASDSPEELDEGLSDSLHAT